MALRSSERKGSIDIGILEKIIMVEYGELKPVMMKVSWMKHVCQGQLTIKKTAMDSRHVD